MKYLFINKKSICLTFFLLGAFLVCPKAQSQSRYQNNSNQRKNFKQWTWKEVNSNALWSPRAGLQVLNFKNNFFLFGGRTPLNPADLSFPVPGASIIWGDVWKSKNHGKSWKEILKTDDSQHWPARAYFKALKRDDHMYILGGQNFNIVSNPPFPGIPPIPGLPPLYAQSDFFNDVWRSKDGIHWNQMTSHAEWSGRAGLSAVTFKGYLYIMGGSVNDDSSITPEGPARIYYNDVWKSKNGKKWELVTEHASWAPRAGGIAVVKDGYIYMIGGEDGFICNPQTPRCPPYYNDVWRTKNGSDWELVIDNAEWQARPGHQVVVAQNRFVLFGGFGLGPDISVAANPMDIWVSNKGLKWKKISDSPWNATIPEDIKYDFDVVVVDGKGHSSDKIFSFGGDRETFNFFDPTNYLNVDNDVWEFSFPEKQHKNYLELHNMSPNPFKNKTKITFEIPTKGNTVIRIINLKGKSIKTFNKKNLDPGNHEIIWNGRNDKGRDLKNGVYILRLEYNGKIKYKYILKKS